MATKVFLEVSAVDPSFWVDARGFNEIPAGLPFLPYIFNNLELNNLPPSFFDDARGFAFVDSEGPEFTNGPMFLELDGVDPSFFDDAHESVDVDDAAPEFTDGPKLFLELDGQAPTFFAFAVAQPIFDPGVPSFYDDARGFFELDLPTPFGTSFALLFVTPIASNLFRAFFTKEPKHISVLGNDDVLNRLLWTISVVSGPATIPIVEQIENPQAQPFVDANFPGAWSVDIRLDRPIVARAVYLVVVSDDLSSADATPMSSPPFDRGTAPGNMLPPARRIPSESTLTLGVDFHYDMFLGTYVLDARQDIATHSGEAAVRKRIFRRLLTLPGAFFHLPGYGVGLRDKQNFSTTRLTRLRHDIERQVLLEEEVESVEVRLSLLAPTALLVSIKVRLRSGQGFEMVLRVPEDGPILNVS